MSWRFAFSTLGCPGASLEDVLGLAAENDAQGVELRVHEEEFLHLGLSEPEAAGIGEQVRAAGLAISALAGYVRVCRPGEDARVVEELRALIRLAEVTGAEAVRVFPGGEDEADAGAQDRIAAVLPQLRAAGVRLLVETHDSHPTGRQALRLVQELGEPRLAAVLWDGLHPWRSGEDPEETRELLGDHLAYFQVKDAVWRDGTWVPVVVGEGQVPVLQQARLLQDFTGWVSLEWERRWHPQIAPLAEALPPAASWFRRGNPA
ncbi:TIM barrel protein [Nesterenkonia xinjiangensis]|uniref:Sugar phosphate isomerase/epimerase n=1 Tax=Nesterenkonia xinjiangensis TaxID=225327 RepID=A0A7Z0GJ66_9MICC|nr:sugar phosphate isomerase/epimerase [Nesterenkonia xinjiangensis]